MQISRLVILVSVMVTVAACQQESTPPASAETNSRTSTEQTIAAKSSPAIAVDPATTTSCVNIVATLKWDTSKAGVHTDSTEIWTGPSGTDTKLFSAGGAAGKIKTGPWTHPGTHFLLKNKHDGKVLGVTVVGGPACHYLISDDAQP